jgi:hypothetical protein
MIDMYMQVYEPQVHAMLVPNEWSSDNRTYEILPPIPIVRL